MNSEIIGSYLVANGGTMPVQAAESLSSNSSRTIYEVIRVMSGVPLFLERHLKRLEASAGLVNSSVSPISGKLRSDIRELIKINGNPDKNVKILVYNLENSTPDYMAYFIESSYPSPEEYSKGVAAILLKEERDNPNAKVVNSSYKERVSGALSDAKAYEALLVNSKNEITEGSRSNLFFVRKGEVLTAPRDKVLIGITRVCVLELCEKLHIKVHEEPVCTDMLQEVDGVFMTGTSPKILPISSVDGRHFDSASNQVIKGLMKGYDNMLDEYIRRVKENG